MSVHGKSDVTIKDILYVPELKEVNYRNQTSAYCFRYGNHQEATKLNVSCPLRNNEMRVHKKIEF